MFERPIKQILARRLEQEERRFIQVLLGPRQVGKTTIIRQIMQDTPLPLHYASSDAVATEEHAWISQQWETARRMCMRSGASEAVLVIDEVQKIKDWSERVKLEWDRDSMEGTRLKLVLLGSSRLLLQKGLSESLAGRFESIYAGHWSFPEMTEAFQLSPEQYAWYGGYPGPVHLIGDEERWKNYVRDALIETSVSRDILLMTRIDKPALLKKLFELGSLYSGQILSYNKILGQLADAGNTTTLAHYLGLLDTAGLLSGLEKFAPGKIRQRSSSPKFQVHNNALLSALSQRSLEEVQGKRDQWGWWVESAIGAHLLNHAMQGKFRLFYWRDRNDEVDFVLTRHDRVIGIEVKSGGGSRKKGISAFRDRFIPHRILLTGEEGIPWQEFLAMDPEEFFA